MMKVPTLLAATLLLAISCVRKDEPIRIQGEAQGTYYNIAYCDSARRNLQPAIDSLLANFDSTASLWAENSLIRKVNRRENPILDSSFCKLLDRSIAIERYTNGAFNCKIGALVNLYGFGFKHRDNVTDAQIDSLLFLIQHGECRYNDSTTRSQLLLSDGIDLDFNAIAQGYAVDLLAGMFDQKGIKNYLIDVGGEVIARGCKPDGSNWTVGIERPAADKFSNREIERAIELRDQSVVTSGNYRKYYEQDGIRYSHTIDPSTGRPVSHSLLSVSVVSREAWYADAMATAFMVMGLEKSRQFIADHADNPDIQAVFFIYDDHGEYKTFATSAFQQLIK
ncbi:MAG: FAD:protein FMN transferase [Bacteroidales bacterium]|nr:FAD:protein FMN transferase [Bacteroidales bacterium]